MTRRMMVAMRRRRPAVLAVLAVQRLQHEAFEHGGGRLRAPQLPGGVHTRQVCRRARGGPTMPNVHTGFGRPLDVATWRYLICRWRSAVASRCPARIRVISDLCSPWRGDG
jgi:hypothetical protein